MEYGLIGEKLGHSFSKIIHEKLADYTYELMPLTKEEFKTFMENREFKAINVTIPYKQEVIPYLDVMDNNSRQIGAVNTIINKNGKLTGHNTDFNGFLYTLTHNNITVKDKKIIVLGNGGAAKAVLAVIKYLQAGEIIIVKSRPDKDSISYEECSLKHKDAEIIINTSPVGMYPKTVESPIDAALFPRLNTVVDIIYNPLKTRLLLQAEELGLKAVNGLEMLVAQAKYAVEYFLEKEIDDKIINTIYMDLLKEMK